MNSDELRSALSAGAQATVKQVLAFDEIDSTNAELIRQVNGGDVAPCVVVAGGQSSGRGRHGKQWYSPSNAGLYMSIGLVFDKSTKDLQALSLITAIAVANGINSIFDLDLQLKWPNDVLCANKKLAGILLEQIPLPEQSYIVFGIGVNTDMPADLQDIVGRPAVDLNGLSLTAVNKELLGAAIVSEVIASIELFREQGFLPFQSQWNSLDRHLGADIVIGSGETRMIGNSKGVNESGCLQLMTLEGLKTVSSGEIFPSLRNLAENEQ